MLSAEPSRMGKGILNLFFESYDNLQSYLDEIVFVFVLLSQVDPGLFNVFNLILKLLKDFHLAHIRTVIIFIQKDQVIAIILLVVLADKDFVKEHCGI